MTATTEGPTRTGFHDHCQACGRTYAAGTKPPPDHWLYGPWRTVHNEHERAAMEGK